MPSKNSSSSIITMESSASNSDPPAVPGLSVVPRPRPRQQIHHHQRYNYNRVEQQSEVFEYNWVTAVVIFLMELIDFVALFMEPFFKWLPVFGLLYVLVPYYNQFIEEEEPEDMDDDCDDYNGYEWK